MLKKGLLLLPCSRREENKHREKLKSAGKHIENKHKLRKNAEVRKALRGANHLKSRSDIVYRRGNSRKVRNKVVFVEGYQRNRCRKYNKVANDICVYRSYYLVADRS